MNIEAVLFDLDNTLILFDETEFYQAYTYKLSQKFTDIFSTSDFVQRLIISTQIMSKNDGKYNNAEYFMTHFSKDLKIDKTEVWRRFEEFYVNDFQHFKYLMKPIKYVPEIIQKIKQSNKKIVIASNPLLPENVQQLRLNWAGLQGIEFDLITHALNSTYCKPNINYYIEISTKLNIPTEKCLMVGNDPFNDMIASKIGMKTYLTTEGGDQSVAVSRDLAGYDNIEIPKPDNCGRINDIFRILNN